MADVNAGDAGAAGAASGLKGLYKRYETLIKYFIIGGSASALDVILFFVLYNWVGMSSVAAQSISVPTSVVYSFIINARHNFKTTDHVFLRLVSFVVVAIIGYGAGLAVILAAEAMGLGGNLGKLVSLPLVFVIQYVLNSRITFRKSKPAAA